MPNLKIVKDRLNLVSFYGSFLVMCPICHKVSIIGGETSKNLSDGVKSSLKMAVEELNNFETGLSLDEYDYEGIDLTQSCPCDSCIDSFKLKAVKNLISQVEQYNLFLAQCGNCNNIWINENQSNFQNMVPEAQYSLREAVGLFYEISPLSLSPNKLNQEFGFRRWTHTYCPVCMAYLKGDKFREEQSRKGYDQCFWVAAGNGKCPYEETDCRYRGYCREVTPEELQSWTKRNGDFIDIPPQLLEKLP